MKTFLMLTFISSFCNGGPGGDISYKFCEEYKRTAPCPRIPGRIIHGQLTNNHEFPHFALIGYGAATKRDEFKCGGSIISDRYIMTAAHCGRETPTIVRVGEYIFDVINPNRKDYGIEEFIPYRSYDEKRLLHDLALIRVTETITFGPNVHPACLHLDMHNNIGKEVVGIGFGGLGLHVDNTKYNTSFPYSIYKVSDTLMKANLKIGYPGDCASVNFVTFSMLCIKGEQVESGENSHIDACRGDSGSPVQIKQANSCYYDVIGITSDGRECGSESGGVYTKVAFYLEWIENIVWKPLNPISIDVDVTY